MKWELKWIPRKQDRRPGIMLGLTSMWGGESGSRGLGLVTMVVGSGVVHCGAEDLVVPRCGR